MFIQVITGTVSDGTGLRAQWDRWRDELRPGAAGFAGGVGGVTPDGRGVIVVRFDDEASAAANAARPEQHAFWQQTRACFDGEPRFDESSDVVTTHGEPTGASRFVQVMRARCSDRAALEATENEIGPLFSAHRPDALCTLRLWQPGGVVTAVDWFTSLEEARAGEAKEPAPELAEGFGRWMSLLSDHEWFDLPDPWHTN